MFCFVAVNITMRTSFLVRHFYCNDTTCQITLLLQTQNGRSDGFTERERIERHRITVHASHLYRYGFVWMYNVCNVRCSYMSLLGFSSFSTTFECFEEQNICICYIVIKWLCWRCLHFIYTCIVYLHYNNSSHTYLFIVVWDGAV